jgi:hypothetical protein
MSGGKFTNLRLRFIATEVNKINLSQSPTAILADKEDQASGNCPCAHHNIKMILLLLHGSQLLLHIKTAWMLKDDVLDKACLLNVIPDQLIEKVINVPRGDVGGVVRLETLIQLQVVDLGELFSIKEVLINLRDVCDLIDQIIDTLLKIYSKLIFLRMSRIIPHF